MGSLSNYAVTLDELAALTLITWEVFNRDHNIRVWMEGEPGLTSAGVPALQNWSVVCEIFSPAGSLQGRGSSALSAFAHALSQRR
jgi:hypothetical protein